MILESKLLFMLGVWEIIMLTEIVVTTLCKGRMAFFS